MQEPFGNAPGWGWVVLFVVIFSLAIGQRAVSAGESSLAQAGPQCFLLAREGKVEVSARGTSSWSVAETNQVLLRGDRLRTGPRSRATLRWSDLSVVVVGELTSMEMAPPQRAAEKPALDVKSGRAYFFNRENPGTVRFRTPIASGAIRGTEFHLAVGGDGRTELALLDGAVDLETGQGALAVGSGELAVAEPGKAPVKTPLLEAFNVIQWVLYYPVVVDPGEVDLTVAERGVLEESLAAYRRGDLRAARDRYPEGRQPSSDGERVMQAALLLGAGEAERAVAVLDSVGELPAAGRAMRELMAAVKHQSYAADKAPGTGSEWLARSYYLQSRLDLAGAREAARRAVAGSPELGPAWVRLAEMEFAFGRLGAALRALEKGLVLSPRHAPGYALQGYILSGQNRFAEALGAFERALALDGGLGDAWLGRGLVRIRQGQEQAGRQDLQVAATLEPQRSILRSYLGKAFSETGDSARAEKELALAKKLDPNDPTPWLYSALVLQGESRVSEAVRELERSKELNDNRSLFRSRLLLDQDQAVRSANLAAIYRDAGLADVSVREAARAVNYDYGNYSSHLFLANSYDALRDPKLINLRYETPWFSELMLAHLLAPVDGGNLSQNVAQQEYSRLFERNHLGLFSSTEYFSSGDWVQSASQYGYFDRVGYALDAYYRTDNGQRPNNDLEQLNLAARVKGQITAKDSLFFQASLFDSESGDVAQYYNQHGDIAGVPAPSKTLRVEETQEPILLAGYHREWAPGLHTLFLGGRFDDTLGIEDQNPALLSLFINPLTGARRLGNLNNYGLDYESELEAYSAELQQIWQTPVQTLVVGGRYQIGWNDTQSRQPSTLTNVPGLTFPDIPPQDFETDLDRVSVYAYEQWQALDSLRLIAGVSYDRLHYPDNIDTSPITGTESSAELVSPKGGVIWSPYRNTHVRGAYTRSLGGVFFDTSVRLEPTQVAGFNQAFRSLLPESVAGLVPATEFETWGAAIDHTFASNTYLSLQGELLTSEADRTVGLVVNDPLAAEPLAPASTGQKLDFEERSFLVTFHRLISREWSAGALYRLTDADLDQRFTGLAGGLPVNNQDVNATLHQVRLFLAFQHRCGFFGQFDSVWSQQSNRDYTPDIPGDDFWQFNIFAGYRFLKRRGEAAVGLLNMGDQDYRLNPLTLYQELPRERTLVARLKLFF